MSEEVLHWAWALRVYKLAALPVLSLCFRFAAEDVLPQLSAPTTTCTVCCDAPEHDEQLARWNPRPKLTLPYVVSGHGLSSER